MASQDNARRAPTSNFALARAHVIDLAATFFVFFSVSIAAGRIWRFPFDDEVFTLSKIEPEAVRTLLAEFLVMLFRPSRSYHGFYDWLAKTVVPDIFLTLGVVSSLGAATILSS
jgi:hypothetical protein